MILLTNGATLTAKLDAPLTPGFPFEVSYEDKSSVAYYNAGTLTLSASQPISSTVTGGTQKILYISIHSISIVSHIVTVESNINSNATTLFSVILDAGASLFYEDGRGWYVILSDGSEKVTTTAILAATLISSHIFVGNASNIATDVAMSGDATIDNTGAVTLANSSATRTHLGATTVGANLFTATNPSAITFLRVNADNSVSFLDAATFRTAIGAGTGSGTVTSVSGTVNRITSTGGATPVIDISASYVGQSSITTLGTITTGVWTGTTIAVANGGTGATSASAARTNLGASVTGANMFTVTDPSAITFLRVNADNSVSLLDATTFRTAIGAGAGTVTGSGSAGQVSFWSSASAVSGDNAFFWDNTNKFLGLGTVVPDTKLTVSGQATIQTPVSGSTGHFIGVDNAPLRITYDTHNNGSAAGTALMGRRSRGTSTTPSATQAGDTLFSINGRGYGTSQYAAGSTGLISIVANEVFTNTDNGTYVSISTTPNSSVTAVETARFFNGTITAGLAGTTLGSFALSGNTSGTATIGTNATGAIVSVDKNFVPATNDGAALGTTALQWSDLFAASGAVLNFANGDLLLTHSTGVLTMTGSGTTQIIMPLGTAAAPFIGIAGATNTGFFASSTSQLNIAIGGTQRFNITAGMISSNTASGFLIQRAAGSNTAPTFSFSGDTNTGMYSAVADTIQFATNGTLNFFMDAAGFTLNTVGLGYKVKEGTNATMGVATLVGGTVTVNTTKVTANSRIFITVQSLGTVAVATPIAVTARVAGTSFTITSSGITDTSVIAWLIVEPS